MPLNRVLMLIVCVVLVLIGCVQKSTVDVDAEADAIRELDRQWDAALKARDLEKFLSFYAPDAVEMPANAPIIVGQQAIRKWFESWITDTTSADTFAPEVIEVAASGDLAYDRGTYHFSQNTPRGRVEDVGKYLLVWKKIDGQWKAVADIGNSDKPLAGQ